MPRLLETIHISNGQALHLNYHQKRLDYSRKCLGLSPFLKLELDPPKTGEFRCRVLYEHTIEKIEYIPYQVKSIQKLKIIHSDIVYDLKYEDRSELNALMDDEADEIIIVRDGLVTDTTVANLCFFDGKTWLTPSTPLLHGTTRQRLLDEGKIRCADIHYKDIRSYQKIAVMNAMVNFSIVENAIIL